MTISPLEIRKKEFEKAFRGYEKEEVDAFLQTLSQEWEKMQEESRELHKKVEFLEKEITRMREVESTIYNTLKTAENTSTNIIEQSNKTAELHIREAHMNAESLLNEARGRARAMIEDAEMEVKNILDDLQIEAKNIEKEYNYIDTQKEYLLDEIKTYVKEALDKVQKFDQKTSRTAFDLKLKEIKNISSPSPIKNLEITNTDAVLSNSENVKKEKKSPQTIFDEEKKTGGSFFDSIG